MIKTLLTLELLDEDYKLLERREQRSRSWLRHFFDLWYILLGNTTNTLAGISDIGGTGRALGATISTNRTPSPNLSVGAPPGNIGALVFAQTSSISVCYLGAFPCSGDTLGIVVGTNNTVVTPTDNALYAKVAHGEGAGQLLHSGCEIYGLTFANPNGSMNIRRYFTNVAGGAITIQEVGIYSPGYSSGGSTGYIFCICRDVVSPGVAINNGQILSVVYTVQITV